MKISGIYYQFLALMLLWHDNATSNQATPALIAQVYFDGEYRIADGQWQKIVPGKHIPAMAGDVTLRGNFHMLIHIKNSRLLWILGMVSLFAGIYFAYSASGVSLLVPVKKKPSFSAHRIFP